ncbi:MAG: TrkH family potassium uptake protein [Coprococcus sp.]
MFTATSAVCVTGLVVHDTATYWSLFGQFVILIMIQIGGMGVVTLAVAITMISGRKIGLMQRSLMQESISAPQVGGIVRLTGFIVRTTIAIELAGTVIMAPVFCHEFGWPKGIWYALFHSISAFCNAGFDLMGIRSQYSSLTSFVINPIINVTIMLLIVIGGIGFATWDDIRSKKRQFRQYRMQSKVVFLVTAILIVVPAVYFYYGEFSGMPLEERFWSSLFQAVTPRTAGFNTADLTTLSEEGTLITIFLMLIGGSPGSTAGGMKTTTIAVLLASAAAVFYQRDEAHCFGRRLPADAIRNASAILLMYLVLFLAGGIIICRMEGLPLLTCLFETASAIGTVGLTLGITPELNLISRGILILLMFFGRVGGLTLIFAAVTGKKSYASKFPQEKITIG